MFAGERLRSIVDTKNLKKIVRISHVTVTRSKRFAKTILVFLVQRQLVGTMLQPFETMPQQSCKCCN